MKRVYNSTCEETTARLSRNSILQQSDITASHTYTCLLSKEEEGQQQSSWWDYLKDEEGVQHIWQQLDVRVCGGRVVGGVKSFVKSGSALDLPLSF